MAATGKTPILLYGSTTPTNAPTAGNLTNSSDGCEIAINVADKNLFFKDSTNAVNTVPIRQSSASSNGWLSSTDWSTFNSKQPAGSYALTTGTLAQFASTTSAQLAGVISDETGTGSLVFATNPNFSSYIGQGVTGSSPYGYRMIYTGTGATSQYGFYIDAYGDSGSTSSVTGIRVRPRTSAASYTTAATYGYIADDPGKGAGSTITAAIGFLAADQTTGNANYGFYSNVSSGASKYNFYANGTADNYFAGNLAFANGKGIDFSATAGTGTSELLADYEEGTWTPTVAGSTTNPTVTYSSRSGTYTKVGRLVTATGIIVLSSTSGGSGNVRITGLPYTNGAQGNVGYIGYASNYTTAKPSQLIVFGAESQVTPYYDSSATASAQLPVSFLTSTSAIYFTVQYETA